jgi:hypothetical protein
MKPKYNVPPRGNDLTVTFKQRSGTHGRFNENANIAMQTRKLWHSTGNWQALAPAQQLALEEIALKVARILSTGADPHFKEHWFDIGGYAKLGEDACTTTS